MKLVHTKQIAETFGVAKVTVYKWRDRYDDHPEARAGTEEWPLFDLEEIWDWYARRWPERVELTQVKLHHWTVDGPKSRYTVIELGGLAETRGYLRAVMDIMYGDWNTYWTPLGFSAHRGNQSEVWAITRFEDPAEWYIYDARFKATGK